MSGIADVARRAGVSKATASRALTGHGYVAAETRTRVEEAARALGYVASTNAASLVTGRTQTVGVVVPGLGRWFFAEVVEGIQEALLEHRYDLALYDARPRSSARTDVFDFFLARKRFDGIIAVGIEPDERELERLLLLNKPVVTIGAYDTGTSSVSIDDESAARIATEHLLGLGHRDITFLGGDPDGRKTSWTDDLRLRGYREAMIAAGAGDSIRHVHTPVSLPGGYAAAVEMLGDRRQRPSGIVAVCDEVAVGAIIAARRLGIHVPADLSVVGIDDHSYAEMFSLTTLQQKPHEQGRAAVQLLMWQIDAGDQDAAPQRIRETSALIVRSSTAAFDVRASAITHGVRPRG